MFSEVCLVSGKHYTFKRYELMKLKEKNALKLRTISRFLFVHGYVL